MMSHRASFLTTALTFIKRGILTEGAKWWLADKFGWLIGGWLAMMAVWVWLFPWWTSPYETLLLPEFALQHHQSIGHRLVSLYLSHGVSINIQHALANILGWFLLRYLIRPNNILDTLLLLLGLPLLGSLLMWQGVAWYVGFSGVLHLYWAAYACTYLVQPRHATVRRLLGIWLTVGLCLKLLIEYLSSQTLLQSTNLPTVPMAHWIGASLGLCLFWVYLCVKKVTHHYLYRVPYSNREEQ